MKIKTALIISAGVLTASVPVVAYVYKKFHKNENENDIHEPENVTCENQENRDISDEVAELRYELLRYFDNSDADQGTVKACINIYNQFVTEHPDEFDFIKSIVVDLIDHDYNPNIVSNAFSFIFNKTYASMNVADALMKFGDKIEKFGPKHQDTIMKTAEILSNCIEEESPDSYVAIQAFSNIYRYLKYTDIADISEADFDKVFGDIYRAYIANADTKFFIDEDELVDKCFNAKTEAKNEFTSTAIDSDENDEDYGEYDDDDDDWEDDECEEESDSEEDNADELSNCSKVTEHVTMDNVKEVAADIKSTVTKMVNDKKENKNA